MLIDEECMAKTTNSEQERQKQDYYEGVFDETSSALSLPSSAQANAGRERLRRRGNAFLSLSQSLTLIWTVLTTVIDVGIPG
jgi:hypothetical protein